MSTKTKFSHIVIRLGIAFLQLVSTQVVTFLVSLLIPSMGNFPGTQPFLFIFVLGLTFSTGVFLTGWITLMLHWLKAQPKLLARLIGSLLGAYLPLLIALIVYRSLEPGNPFFFISMLTSVMGFYVVEWIAKN